MAASIGSLRAILSGTNTGTHNRTYRRKAFSMLEAVVTVMFFGVLIVIFGATFPLAMSAGGTSAAYNQAAQIAQHKVDELRQAGFSQLNQPALITLGIIDSTANADGSFSFTTVDNLVDNGTSKGFFGPGSTGKLSIGQALNPLGTNSNAPPTLRALQVTVTITWQGAGLHSGSFTTHSVIAAP